MRKRRKVRIHNEQEGVEKVGNKEKGALKEGNEYEKKGDEKENLHSVREEEK